MSDDGVFVGPCVQVIMKSPANGGMYENVYLRQFGGRNFLVGALAPFNPNDTRAGRETWMALDQVQMFIHFPDLAAAQDYWNAYRREKAKTRKWWRR